MVKNVKGGSRHKKQARKHAQVDEQNIKTRLKDSSEPCEVYAVVKQMYGQGNCEVMCSDGDTLTSRLCVIRKIFKGRNKHQNRLMVGTYVLVGLRDWETAKEGKKEKCDLLEVYQNRDIESLKKDKNFNQSLMKVVAVHGDDDKDDEQWEFNYGEEEQDKDVESEKKEKVGLIVNEDEEIDIDDI